MQKKIFLSLLFITFILAGARSQNHEQDRVNKTSADEAKKIFDDKDKDFTVSAIPDKWKNESAVIIAQKFIYTYTAAGLSNRLLEYTETTRRRIKILDKAAVDNFSTFYFYSTKSAYGASTNEKDNFAIQIIKPDGSIKNIYKQDAIKVQASETPSIFQAHFNTNLEYYKVALPDVAAGDIIDYFLIVNGSDMNYTHEARDLPPVITTLIGDYPIMKQKINFIVDRGFFINFKSSNGAPDLVKNVNIDHNTYSFSLVDQDRPRVEDTRWLFPYRQLPTIKFQLVWSKVGKESEFFLGDVDQPKSSVTADEIAQKVNYTLSVASVFSKYYIDLIESRMKKDHRNLANKNDIARYCYYYFRNIAFSESTFSSYSAVDLGYMPSTIFTKVMYEVLQDYEVPCEVVVVPNRSISNISDVVLAGELNYCIKVGDQYIFTFDENSNFSDPNPYVAGQAAYSVKVSRKESARKAVPLTIPVSSAPANMLLVDFNASFDDDMENLVVQDQTTASGSMKDNYDYVALIGYDWEKTDYLAYGGPKPEEEKSSGNKNRIAEEERKRQAKEDEDRKDLMDKMKDFLKDDYSNVVSYDDFDLKSDGRSPEKSQLVYTEKFKLGDLVKKVGPNYTVSAGALIGDQLQLEEKEMKRDYDIWLNYPRVIAYTVTLNLPAGYKAEGIEALNNNIDNATGSFVSTAKVDGQKLTIDVKKTYKVDYVKKEDWPKMIEFLDGAYNFTQKKIVISKGS